MGRDRLESEPTEFEAKVEALVEKLGEDIASIASDGEEFANGIAQAAVLLLEHATEDDDFDTEDAFDPIGTEYDPSLEDDDLDDDWDDDLIEYDPFAIDEDEDHGP